MLKIAMSISEKKFNVCWIFVFFVTSSFFNQTFKIVKGIKILHRLTNYSKTKVIYKYKSITSFSVFTAYNIQVVLVIKLKLCGKTHYIHVP